MPSPLASDTPNPRVLVAGMGNVLHGDDGFGPEVVRALTEVDLPGGVTVLDVGTGGLHLVQALLDGYDGLIVIDAVDREAEPGTLFVLVPDVPDIETYSAEERHEMLVDMHYTVPSRAMILARALDSLPGRVWIVGVQPLEVDVLRIGLSDTVAAAVPGAVQHVVDLVGQVSDRGAPSEHAPRPLL